jgi:hypothetical protein
MPGAITVTSGETLVVGADLSLNTGTTVLTSPTAQLLDITNGEPGTPVSLGTGAGVTGSVVTQRVTGLTPLHTYRILLGATANGATWQAAYIIECPY